MKTFREFVCGDGTKIDETILASKKVFEENVERFIKEINSKSKIVKVVVKKKESFEQKEENKTYNSITFEALFVLKDPYVKTEVYEKGAVIYLSDRFYKDVEKLGKKYFGKTPMYNNTMTIFWF